MEKKFNPGDTVELAVKGEVMTLCHNGDLIVNFREPLNTVAVVRPGRDSFWKHVKIRVSDGK